MNEQQILEAIQEGTLFGLVECDIKVPEPLRTHFDEMTPIFKNTKICRDDIGEPIKNYAEQNKLMSQPQRSLIGSYYGEKILLATPLLQWYMEHGLVVTKIYQVGPRTVLRSLVRRCPKHAEMEMQILHRLLLQI